ncbi:Xaa-Pro peptidase family protein [Pelagibius sp. Alg239-R121]|uniref:M24 family metallopeptidase n=1 Tax=Pelagibius sp. Alg239-R121 TaxID=2993448 RepID=UPI0024A71564|nr:Xaa-Pro peptidase family protein [Pelagibius sp. Alg239-R121]
MTTAAMPSRRDERVLWPGELSFPLEDFSARLILVQKDLTRRALNGALIFDPENMYWLTGFQTIGYFTFQAMYVPADGLPTVITRIVNRDMALALPTIGAVEPVLDTEDHVDVLRGFLEQTGRGRLGLETLSRYLCVHDYRRLLTTDGLEFVDWDWVIESQRAVKTGPQIDRMRAAARTVEAGIDAALKTIAPGRTDNDVAAALYHGSIAAGSEYIGHPPMVVSGKRSALCFALWKRKVIARGDVVLLEGAGCIDRYHVMMSRSAVVGPPTDEQKAAAEALISILETAVETIKPGETAGAIDRKCRDGVEKLGLGKYFKSRVAYGIGIGFPPNWAEGHIYAIRPDDPMLLRENMTFHVIPTIFREDFGMAISDSVRVTSTGCEVLTKYPRDLVIVDCDS